MEQRQCSYPFTPMKFKDSVIARPFLQCNLSYKGKSFQTFLLVDSGADYSVLERDVAIDGLQIDIEKLTSTDTAGGMGGSTRVAFADIDIAFSMGPRYIHQCTIPFQIPLDEGKGPPFSLLGREPFFHDFKVIFRLGYTKDPAVGKFNLHMEKVHRTADHYKKPVGFG